jgi:hypothetical protein
MTEVREDIDAIERSPDRFQLGSAAVVDYLRSSRPVSLTRIEPSAARNTRVA